MTAKKYLLIGAAVAAIAGLTAVGEVSATNPPPVCTPTVCNSQTHATQPQVQCGTKNGCPVCVNVLPSTPVDTGSSCQFEWKVFNIGTSSFNKAAVAYECTPGTAATSPLANGCGVGNSSSSYPAKVFKGIFQLDSVSITPVVNTGFSRIAYTINNSCADRGPNDVVLKYGDDTKTCNGPIEGFGATNTFATTTGCQEQSLGDSGCTIKTCFVRDARNNIISYEITPVSGNCTVGVQGELGGGVIPGVTDIPDGTIIKIGTNSCYQVTYKRKTTWIATETGEICPPSS